MQALIKIFVLLILLAVVVAGSLYAIKQFAANNVETDYGRKIEVIKDSGYECARLKGSNNATCYPVK